jgi:glycosylphosphatidylinositol transamidase
MPTIAAVLLLTPLVLSLLVTPSTPPLPPIAPLSSLLKCFNLIIGGLAIAVVATLNFGAAVVLSLYLCGPLLLARPLRTELLGRVQQWLLVLLSPPIVWSVWNYLDSNSSNQWLTETLLDWHVVGTAGVPFTLVVIVPLLLQAATAALL